MSSTRQRLKIRSTIHDRPLDSDTLIIQDDEAIEIISCDQTDIEPIWLGKANLGLSHSNVCFSCIPA
jgi:hypothetical protein